MEGADNTKPLGKVERYTTREEWLLAAIAELTEHFKSVPEFTPPKTLRVSVGFPLGSRKAIGQHWAGSASKDKSNVIFISPVLEEPATKDGVLSVLLHELCHGCLPEKTGHKRPFQKLAASVGLVGPWTATTASPELVTVLERIARKLGAYPHSKMTPFEFRKKQTTRLLKIECEPSKDGCGLILRASLKAIEQILKSHDGITCPCCGEYMTPETGDE